MNVAAKAPRPGGGWRTALFVVAALILIEIGIRAVETRLSIDSGHIVRIGTIIDTLESERSEQGATTVLFFGNSLTRRGVDVSRFEAALESLGMPEVQAAAVYPDDSSVLDWLYLYESAIISRDSAPDVVVIGFGATHLEDAPLSRAQSHRLGRYFVPWRTIPTLFGNDVTTVVDRVNVLAAKISATFANRERIAQRLLSFLPYYQEGAQRVNQLNRLASVSAGGMPSSSYDRLRRLVNLIEGSGAELILMAMPTRVEYLLDPSIVEVAHENGATYIDARAVPGLSLDMFEDDLHLDPATGTQLYTEHAAALLAPLLAAAGDVR